MVLLFYFVDPTKSQKRGVVMETPGWYIFCCTLFSWSRANEYNVNRWSIWCLCFLSLEAQVFVQKWIETCFTLQYCPLVNSKPDESWKSINSSLIKWSSSTVIEFYILSNITFCNPKFAETWIYLTLALCANYRIYRNNFLFSNGYNLW